MTAAEQPQVWFDSHCHLYDVADPEEALARARDAGVIGVVVPGTDATTSTRAVDLSNDAVVWAGAAIHPSETRGWQDDWIDPIDDLLRDERVVAVGETGLDLYRDTSYVEDQKKAFAAHIELVKRHDKALVIHTRESVDEVLDMLVDLGPPERLVFHCWSGNTSQLERALGVGAFVSFAGNVSFKNAVELRTVAALVPQDRLLVETDSPYLAPEPKRGRPNEPAFVVQVGEAVAECRGTAVAEVAAVTTANARSLFGLP